MKLNVNILLNVKQGIIGTRKAIDTSMKKNCAINHITCAEPMKKEVAVKMFLRSIEIIGLNYTNKCLGWGLIFSR